MKIPSRKIELAKALDPGYGDFYFSLPRSLTEGHLHQIQLRNLEIERLSALSAAADDPEKSKALEIQELDFRRESNAMSLDLIDEWNFTDKDEQPLALPRAVKSDRQKLAIMEQLPIEVIRLVGEEIWNLKPAAEVGEATADFSSESSEAHAEAT